ncbi:innexin inx2-like [Dermatophagoides pteronyssinus]|uniref:innexin inx2-like n=1 Tax=Dermatophagoides pteronyssinus TaxID=6956 RepID=UPI003F66D3CA
MFEELRALFSFLQRRSLSIDGLVFGIVCRMTAIIMLAGLVVVCSNQLIGKLINCDNSMAKVETEFLNTFCLIHTTYIVYESPFSTVNEKFPSYRSSKQIGIFPGVRLNRVNHYDQSSSDPLIRIFIDYYHWLWMIYFIGGLWFYFPHWLWKKLECRRIRSLVSHADMLVDHQHNKSNEYLKLKQIANYIVTSFGSNDRYMWGYYFCEIIAFVNLFLQMYTLDTIFNGRYLNYGIDAIQTFWKYHNDKTKSQDLNPINMIFPRMTKCEYRRYGPSGKSENIDSLCMLPMNIFNDKFFLFIWFWIIIMLIAFMITFLHRLAQIMWPKMRTKFLCDLLMKSANCNDSNMMIDLLTQLRMSDWFFLNLIANNVDRLFLGQLLTEISIILREKNRLLLIEVDDDDIDNDCKQTNDQQPVEFPDSKSSPISISGH